MMKPYEADYVLKETLDYFDGDDLAANAWITKYCVEKDGVFYEATPADMHSRMANEFARVESALSDPKVDKTKLSAYGSTREQLSAEKIFGLFDRFKYVIPQGSVMSLLGNPFKTGSLSNCVVLPDLFDSYGGINHTDGALQALMKRRCGVGVDISGLRPADAEVKNSAGTSTGAASFMERFSNTTREVAQSGRRGALMLTIDVAHPDVEKFVTMKQELNRVTGANVSVRLSDEFMRAVESGSPFLLRWPIDAPISEAKYTKEIQARDLWDTIVKCAHSTAEPGLIFWDRQHWYSTSSIYPGWENKSTNPCCFWVNSEVMVVTDSGLKEIKEVTSDDLVWVDTEKRWAKNSGYFFAGLADVFEVTLSNGEVLYITENHKLGSLTSDYRGRVNHDFKLRELKELSVGDAVVLHDNPVEGVKFSDKGSFEDGMILGWLAGDGCLTYRYKGQDFPEMVLPFWKKEHDLIGVYKSIVKNIPGIYSGEVSYHDQSHNEVKRLCSTKLTRHFTEKFETNLWNVRKGDFPLETFSEDFIKGYLAAYFTADGTIANNPSGGRYAIQLASINKEALFKVKNILNLWGIRSSVSVLREEGESTFGGKTYISKKCFRLTISGKENLLRFGSQIRFLSKFKLETQLSLEENLRALNKATPRNYAKIRSIECIGEKVVGCISVEDYHMFTANGCISGNSEIAMNNDSCRLIAVNMYSFVEDPFKENAKFDFEKWYKICYEAQRLGDDLVELELEAVQRILDKIDADPEPDYIKATERRVWQELYRTGKEGRRTGTGYTGHADTLAALGLRYDSEDALKMTEKIMKIKCKAEFDSSIDMAVERGGPFKDYDAEVEVSSEFVQMLRKELPDTYSRMTEYGRRNISISTVAPTGTLSLLAQTSSGIEPVFMLSYTRRRKLNNDAKEFDFQDDLGDKWKEFTVYHPKLSLVENPGPIEDGKAVEESNPYYKSTAEEIDWHSRVAMQAVVQKYITHSISSTINLPENVPQDVVSGIYLEAWKKGLKGITVYRSGSRSGVLISESKNEAKTKFGDNHAPKRPKKLPASVYFFQNHGEKWVGVIGLYEGRPYELFTGKADALGLIGNVDHGYIVKRKSGHYDFEYQDGHGRDHLVEGIGTCFSKEFYNYGRFVSGLLRHGMPVPFVVDLVGDIKLSKDSLNTWKSGVSRILKKYISDGTKAADSLCENCGDPNGVVYQEGCLTCTSCGTSKCG